MFTQHLDDLKLVSGGGLGVAFPVAGQAGTAAVYFELDPGATLETHADSAEEILYVVAGTVEATVGEEVGRLDAGGLAVVPANVPHGARNVGEDRARVLGFFAGGTIVSEFEQPPFPDAPQLFVNGQPVLRLEAPAELSA